MKELNLRARSLAVHLGISFLLFTLCRIVFFAYNHAFFPLTCSNGIQVLAVGMWFDTVPVFYYNLLVILLHTLPHPWWGKPKLKHVLRWAFLVPNSVAVAQNLMDVAFFPFSKKRTGAEIFHLSSEWDGAQLTAYLADFWFIVLLFVGFIYLTWQLLSLLYRRSASPTSFSWSIKTILAWCGYFLFCVGMTILGLRGGWGLIPLRTFDAGKYVPPHLVPLAINTPFQLICTIEGTAPTAHHFMPDAEAELLLKPWKKGGNGTFAKKNVVIIIVESLGKEYMGFYNHGKGYTPFLDSLCKESLSFSHSFANGSVSLDAPPALFSGIPHLMEDNYIVSSYNTNTPQSLGSLLHSEGYNSSFYHGARNGSMGFDNFISLAGMGEYYGLDQYPDKSDFDGKWGIFDEPYLAYFAQELSRKKQPFVSAVFTLSSHHPYTVPAKYKDRFPEGTLPIHKSIGYTDWALRQFFAQAKQQAWYSNTLFVLTADHTSDSDNPHYQSTYGRYEIPILFYTPDGSLKETRQQVMQQSLVLPTVMDILGYPKPYYALGNSCWQNGAPTYAVLYTGGHYHLLQDSLALSMYKDGSTSNLYNYWQDPSLGNEIGTKHPREKQHMEKLLKAYLQEYSVYLSKNVAGAH